MSLFHVLVAGMPQATDYWQMAWNITNTKEFDTFKEYLHAFHSRHQRKVSLSFLPLIQLSYTPYLFSDCITLIITYYPFHLACMREAPMTHKGNLCIFFTSGECPDYLEVYTTFSVFMPDCSVVKPVTSHSIHNSFETPPCCICEKRDEVVRSSMFECNFGGAS